MPRKSTNKETVKEKEQKVVDTLPQQWHSAMNNIKWTEYAIRCRLFSNDELETITSLLAEYAKKGKEKAFN